jgi:hypothetical protein
MFASNNERRCDPLLPRFFRGLEMAAAWTAGAAVFLGFQSTNAADPPEMSHLRGLSLPNSPLTTQDCQLALFAREALLKDEVLGPLNLGVTVHSGVATLWGTVPKVAVARLAEEKMRGVPGLAQVKNELRIITIDEDTAEFLGTLSFRPRSLVHEQARRWNQPVPLVSRGEASSSISNKGAASPLMMPPIQVPAEPERTVLSFSPPAPSLSERERVGMTESVLKVSSPPPLIEVLERLRRSNERFRLIRFEVQGGVVHLWCNAANSADVFTLAQQVSHLPGVERVVVERGR